MCSFEKKIALLSGVRKSTSIQLSVGRIAATSEKEMHINFFTVVAVFVFVLPLDMAFWRTK